MSAIGRAKTTVGQGVRRAQARLGRLVFERGLPEDTDAWVSLEDLDGTEGRTRYEPSPYFNLFRALRGERIGRGHVFIDYGSGKGRVVFLAGRLPFGRVMGVEVAEQLNVAARRNADVIRDRLKCRDIEFVTADVLDWDPPDDITHAYFYNPFSGRIFDAAVAALLASYDRRPRDLRIIYANPTMAAALEATGRVRKVRTVGSRLRGVLSRQIAIYEVLPASP